jgi:NAD-dependent dihydropyrimidine dehydrogenase PreA subunit
MTATSAPALRVILFEGAGARSFTGTERLELLRALLEKGYHTTVVRNGGVVTDAVRGALVVLGRFNEPKPPTAEAADGSVHLRFHDIDGIAPAAVVELVDGIRDGLRLPRPGAWKPWFPVIDYKRCTNCMQCLSFCLFDVYGVSTEGKIQVRNETNCKTDCPACSRVCPEVAILFPKYRHGPINGDEINSEDVRREAMKVDISALLGGDIYQALRDRSAKAKSRFSKERDDERALKERQRCLVALGKALDVPAEVLASLPSIDQIRSKAAEAQARATDALNANARSVES